MGPASRIPGPLAFRPLSGYGLLTIAVQTAQSSIEYISSEAIGVNARDQTPIKGLENSQNPVLAKMGSEVKMDSASAFDLVMVAVCDSRQGQKLGYRRSTG